MKKVMNFVDHSNVCKDAVNAHKRAHDDMKYIIRYNNNTYYGEIDHINYDNKLVTLEVDKKNEEELREKTLLLLAVTNYISGVDHYGVLDFITKNNVQEL